MARRRRKRGRSGKRPVSDQQQGVTSLTGLTRALAPDVEPDVRQRGEGYYRQGRVMEPKATADRLSAEVKGKGGNYQVTVDMAYDQERKRSTVSAICSCPFFAEGRGCCKHIWAVLCMADGIPECEFRAPQGHPVGFLKRTVQVSRRVGTVVSAAPGESGRIRAFTASDFAAVAAKAMEPEPRNTRSGSGPISWREALKMVGHAQRDTADHVKKPAAQGTAEDVHYIIDVDQTEKSRQLTVQIFRVAPPGGEAGGQLVAAAVDPRALEVLADGPDREILAWFFGVAPSSVVRSSSWEDGVVPIRTRSSSFVIAESLREGLLERLCATGRFGWLAVDEAKLESNGPFPKDVFRPITFDGGGAWTFRLGVAVRRPDMSWTVRGEFRRGGATVPLAQVLAAFPDGLTIFKDKVVRGDTATPRSYGWAAALMQSGPFRVDKSAQAAFLRAYVEVPASPPIDLPAEAGWTIVSGVPKPKLVFLAMPVAGGAVMMANYDFTYEAPPPPSPGQAPSPARGRRGRGRGPVQEAPPPSAEAQDADPPVEMEAVEPAPPEPAQPAQPAPPEERGRLVLRGDKEKEDALIKELTGHPGVHPSAGRAATGADVFVDAANLAELVADLSGRGWSVEAEGQKLRAGKSFNIDVKSGANMDWLDLRARFDFGDGATVELPRLLEALKSGSDRVQLGDGTVGLLPDSWLKSLDPILRMGEEGESEDTLRYKAGHAAFLDILAGEAKTARLDDSFKAYREKLARFNGIEPSEADAKFTGELRPYQKQGLGWLEFLDEFAFGGCLADDMGLGKTIQVLAHLQKRKRAAKAAKKGLPPTLIVCPTSLIHNWVDEAKRFTPDLKFYAHVGPDRDRDEKSLKLHDVIVTSYGTMRSDVELLGDMNFDYAILDESQAIKNETTQSAKAARSLQAHRRLAMSGTPVENRLAELGSLFRYLNPGMLDNSSGFAELFAGASKMAPGKLQTLAKALRPFILRRTKEQVLPDLPGKTENTVYCVLEGDQRKEYDQLAAHYRDALKGKVKTGAGLGKNRMQVLEALLRLRQLACHPGLIDPKRAAEGSAKLDLLEEQLEEVIGGGHKALVFSQFTSMLALVRARLDEKGIVYEYLDGSTTDRKERVESFQSNDKIKIFLISLKAGGVGLNLTAADYCFILDPWWNPASEAQAIDRAHRIGQKSHVFAYRLIARGTVEEKILDLQAAKRKLVEGIIADDGDVLSEMTVEDLDFLLG